MQQQQRDYKAKYYELRRSAKELLFENSAYQSEIDECRGKIVKRERERELLLQHLLQYEQEEWELQREVYNASIEKAQHSHNNKVIKKQTEPPEPIGLNKIPKIKIVFQDSKGPAAVQQQQSNHHHNNQHGHHNNHHHHHHHSDGQQHVTMVSRPPATRGPPPPPPDPILEHHHHQQIQRHHHAAPPPPQPVPQPPSKHKIKRAKVEPIVISLPAVVAKEAKIRNSSIRAMLNPALITPDHGNHGNHGNLMEDPEAELARMKLTTAQALKTFKQRFESLSAANLEKRAAAAALAAQTASSNSSGGRPTTSGGSISSGSGGGSSGGSSKEKDPPYYPPNEHPPHQ
eukprot:sb/3466362/